MFEKDTRHRLSIFAFHIQTICQMKEGEKVSLSFWDRVPFWVHRDAIGRYSVNVEGQQLRCVGNVHGATQAYVDHVAGN